jgi:hypothetical protein
MHIAQKEEMKNARRISAAKDENLKLSWFVIKLTINLYLFSERKESERKAEVVNRNYRVNLHHFV